MLERLLKSECRPLENILGMSMVKTFLVRGTLKNGKNIPYQNSLAL
jgi:hypothetical protein